MLFLEEWYKHKKNYLTRVEKVLELDGGRIEPEYFKKKRGQYMNG